MNGRLLLDGSWFILRRTLLGVVIGVAVAIFYSVLDFMQYGPPDLFPPATFKDKVEFFWIDTKDALTVLTAFGVVVGASVGFCNGLLRYRATRAELGATQLRHRSNSHVRDEPNSAEH